MAPELKWVWNACYTWNSQGKQKAISPRILCLSLTAVFEKEVLEDANYTRGSSSPVWKTLGVDWLAHLAWLINQGPLGGNEHRLQLIIFPEGKKISLAYDSEWDYFNLHLNAPLFNSLIFYNVASIWLHAVSHHCCMQIGCSVFPLKFHNSQQGNSVQNMKNTLIWAKRNILLTILISWEPNYIQNLHPRTGTSSSKDIVSSMGLAIKADLAAKKQLERQVAIGVISPIYFSFQMMEMITFWKCFHVNKEIDSI